MGHTDVCLCAHIQTQVSKPRLVKRLSEQSASSEGSYGGMASLMNTPVHKSPGSSGDLATLEDFQVRVEVHVEQLNGQS